MMTLVQRYKQLSVVMALTLGSQVLSAGSSLLLPLLGLHAADTYSVAAQIGLTGFTGVTVGILYNIAIGRPGFRSWRIWMFVSAGVSIGAVVFQSILLWHTGFVETHGVVFVWSVFVLYGVGGIFISTAATYGVREACQGRPLLFASTTVYPNAGLVLGILVGALTHLAAAPAIGWFTSSALLLVVGLRTSRLARNNDSTADLVLSDQPRDTIRSQITGLLLGVLASTLMPMLYLAALSQLAVGIIYIATLVSRIVNASVALTVNSALLVRFNWKNNDQQIGVFPQAASAIFSVLTVFSCLTIGLRAPGMLNIVLVVIGWLAGVIASSILVRQLNATRRGRTILVKSLVEVALTGAFAAVMFSHPSLVGYFGCFALSSALTVLVAGLVLRYRWITITGTLSLFGAMLIICNG